VHLDGARSDRSGGRRLALGGCLLAVVGLVGFAVLGFTYALGDPCLPFCVADTGPWGTLTTLVFAATGIAYLALWVRLVRGRFRAGVVGSTVGLAFLVLAIALAALIGADVVTAEPQFCNC
jgi:hypothetical protein